MRIVETDNHDNDYPIEIFVNLPVMDKEHATLVAKAINKGMDENGSRYWKVVENDYKPLEGFAP